MAEYDEKSPEKDQESDSGGKSEGKTPAEWHKKWTKEIAAAKKRSRKFQKTGNKVVQRFLDERDAGNPYERARGDVPSRLNLFHKNISTIMAMLYGQTPQIDVVREHYDPDDDVARVASLLYQRILQADVEPSGEDLSCVLKSALQDRLLPGLGVARVRYTFDAETDTSIDPDTMDEVETERVTDERAPVDYVHWQDCLWGWCRTWKDLPWFAFRSWLDKKEVEERFGKEYLSQLEFKNQTPNADDENGPNDGNQRDNVQKAEIWEIWCKSSRKVFWYSEGSSRCLDVKDDPLGLRGFWPMPKPMMANITTSLMMPKADFLLAQDLYNEIDELQSRIAIITKAIKVVGVYDKSASESVGRMLKEGVENDLIPVDNWAMFSEKGGLQGSIDWFPVQDVVGVLQTLQGVQAEKTQQLYEITGLSDIMRGANTDQYTAAATQGMKAKMGSIAVQALQDEFARFASELEELKAEIISKHFEKETIVYQANAGFLPEADKFLVAPALELMKSTDVKWRVNIKPESLAMIDYAQIKSERTEFLMSMAQYIQSASTAVQAVPGSLPILLELMKWGMAGFKGAEYLEGTFDQAIEMAQNMPPPGQEEQQGPSPEELKLQIEQMKLQGQQQKIQGEIQKIQTKAQADMQGLQAKLQMELARIQADADADQTLTAEQSRTKIAEIMSQLDANLTQISAQLEADLQLESLKEDSDLVQERASHEYKMAEIALMNRGKGNGTV